MMNFIKFYGGQTILAIIPILQIKLLWLIAEPAEILQVLQAQIVSFIYFTFSDNLDGFSITRENNESHLAVILRLISRRYIRLILILPIFLIFLRVLHYDVFPASLSLTLTLILILNPAQYARNFMAIREAFCIDFTFKMIVFLIIIFLDQLNIYIILGMLTVIVFVVVLCVLLKNKSNIAISLGNLYLSVELNKMISVMLGAASFNFVPIMASFHINDVIQSATFLSIDRLLRGFLVLVEPARLFILRKLVRSSEVMIGLLKIINMSVMISLFYVIVVFGFELIGFFTIVLGNISYNKIYLMIGICQIIIANISLLYFVAQSKYGENAIVFLGLIISGFISVSVFSYLSDIYMYYFCVELCMLTSFLAIVGVIKKFEFK